MENDIVSLFGKPVLTIPDIEVRTKNISYVVTDSNGIKIDVVGKTFGMSGSIRFNKFNEAICYSLSKSACYIYFYICFKMEYNSNIVPLVFRDIVSKTGLSSRSIPNAIKELIDKKVIYKTVQTSVYVVNPHCITNCNTESFEKAYNVFKEKYKVSVNSKNELIYSRYEDISF